MSFLKAAEVDSKERFSLLLLEPGEIYFQDFSVVCFPLGISEQESSAQSQKGRLKLCSKSVVFDPKDFSHPLRKFPLVDVSYVGQWNGTLFSKIGRDGRSFVIETKQVIEMKSNDVIAPYKFIKVDCRLLFTLVHSKVEDCLPCIMQLHRASTLPIADRNVMISAIVFSRQSRHKFDTTRLDDFHEEIILQMEGDRVTPLVTNPGHVVLTSSKLYFQPFNNICVVPVLKIRLSDVRQVIRRRFLLKEKGLEIYCREGTNSHCPHLYLSLRSEGDRNNLFHQITSQEVVKLDDLEQDTMLLRWQNGLLSNFEYISYLNSMADRSINDLTQYPVFPWVVSDYTSTTLDLANPETYRDLSKPMGALNPERLERLLERYKDAPEPKFLYGTHYSTPGYILFFLARAAPEYLLCLHGGHFDSPDRMFNSMPDVFRSCTTSMSDFKELIPEFYDSDGSFLQNTRLINFGVRQSGHVIGDVELPPWANRSPDLMISRLREALESDYVSSNLHHWIDLIFGYKQRGDEAIAANNVFYYMTYEGAVDLERIADPNERLSKEVQIMEFGQTPKQLFRSPHPQRFQRQQTPDPVLISRLQNQCSNSTDSEILESKEDINELHLRFYREHNLHRDAITDVQWMANGQKIISISQDGFLKVYSVADDQQQLSLKICNMPISSFELTSDGKSVMIGSWDNQIYIYNLEYGRIQNRVFAHQDAVSQLCVLNDVLLSCSWDASVKAWEYFTDGRQNLNLSVKAEMDHEAGVNCIAPIPQMGRLVSGTKDGHVSVWDPENSTFPIRSWQAHEGEVQSLTLSRDNRQIVSCGADGFLRLFDANTMMEIFSKEAATELRCAAWWQDRKVVSGCSDGSLLVWDLTCGSIVEKIAHSHQGVVSCLHVGTDQRICSGGTDKLVKLWSEGTI